MCTRNRGSQAHRSSMGKYKWVSKSKVHTQSLRRRTPRRRPIKRRAYRHISYKRRKAAVLPRAPSIGVRGTERGSKRSTYCLLYKPNKETGGHWKDTRLGWASGSSQAAIHRLELFCFYPCDAERAGCCCETKRARETGRDRARLLGTRNTDLEDWEGGRLGEGRARVGR